MKFSQIFECFINLRIFHFLEDMNLVPHILARLEAGGGRRGEASAGTAVHLVPVGKQVGVHALPVDPVGVEAHPVHPCGHPHQGPGPLPEDAPGSGHGHKVPPRVQGVSVPERNEKWQFLSLKTHPFDLDLVESGPTFPARCVPPTRTSP